MTPASLTGWDDDPAVATWRGFAPLEGNRTADACVVGLGGSGMAAVAALADRGLTVVGVDAGRVAARAAGRNGGLLLAGSAAFLHRAIASWGAEAAVGLYRATLAEIDALSERLGGDLIRRTGSIRLAGQPGDPVDDLEAADRARELDDCAQHAVALRAHGFAVRDYDGDLGRGLFLPDDAVTNPARRVLLTATALSTRAALHEATPVTAIEPGRVVTGRGTISAPVIIVAVDGRLDLLLPQLAGRVRTARLQMLTTAPISRRLDRPVYARWGYDYAQADAAGRLFVGGGRDLFEADEWTASDDWTQPIQSYLEGFAARVAGAPVAVERRWASSVGYTEDGRALVSEVAPGVVACGGYSGTGNLVGPVAARAAVALAVDGQARPSYFGG